ncbi:XkdX family protein [Pediococcus pentosaceus]|uniref:XkdX family protein n=1 Tax=Pediococcus pentosaceus TaxID=1255 RepID=A0A6L5A498_PEDPE|nr:XkdX family protein [Pediococcus pentosaceus]KAF0348559.1 XkdX family protein [Pediococcus pentosaceus]KAF0415084.1 XkdX family protein [Pediococcus pentosaceus]KAF0502765.1 XkdX family protein [Pediococcus pentosaceus]MBF7105537.1 XkdX family protein [Pediococcus pentosaceus]MBF7126453.1 XkdX family protein [Pediococcus pentosaceus]
MTTFEQCKIFWSWGNHELDYYQIYVQLGQINADQYKDITGEVYVAPTQ